MEDQLHGSWLVLSIATETAAFGLPGMCAEGKSDSAERPINAAAAEAVCNGESLHR